MGKMVEEGGGVGLRPGVTVRVAHARERIQSVCSRTFKDGLFQFAHRLPPKRQHSRHHEIQHNTQRPDIHRPAFVALVSEELGRGVRRRPTERGQGLALQTDGAEPKVSHLDRIWPGEKDVLRLEVAMYYVHGVLWKELAFDMTFFSNVTSTAPAMSKNLTMVGITL